MKFALLAPLLLVPVFSAIAQEPTIPADPAKVEVKLDAKQGAPGAAIKGKVKVTFSPGWHGYQNPPTHDFEIPLKVATSSKGVVLKASSPKGVMKGFTGTMTAMYEGTVEIPITLTLPKKPGALSIQFDVSYQQCNSSSCLPPEKVSATEKVTVKVPTKKPK